MNHDSDSRCKHVPGMLLQECPQCNCKTRLSNLVRAKSNHLKRSLFLIFPETMFLVTKLLDGGLFCSQSLDIPSVTIDLPGSFSTTITIGKLCTTPEVGET